MTITIAQAALVMLGLASLTCGGVLVTGFIRCWNASSEDAEGQW